MRRNDRRSVPGGGRTPDSADPQLDDPRIACDLNWRVVGGRMAVWVHGRRGEGYRLAGLKRRYWDVSVGACSGRNGNINVQQLPL